jgi:hypothetical protein
MLQKATESGLIRGLGTELVRGGGCISLQYADGTILFLSNDVQKAENLKWILTYFELLLGMRMNYHKSEIVPINMVQYCPHC